VTSGSALIAGILAAAARRAVVVREFGGPEEAHAAIEARRTTGKSLLAAGSLSP
jgi:hypothetical protein